MCVWGGGHNILTTRFDLTADAPSVSLLCRPVYGKGWKRGGFWWKVSFYRLEFGGCYVPLCSLHPDPLHPSSTKNYTGKVSLK